jgi:hypothetical protein
MVTAFRTHFRVPYEIALRVIKADQIHANLPPEIEGVVGFPVTVFVNRDGTVRAIRTGAISPAAGEDYQRFRADIDKLVADIVASRDP